ncbi:hypothetical protein ACFO0N_07220 [Halobium salinum]|uniref:Glycosyltransferase RgtA/B/C/D-like domain-containing protein n=1 Tax=Halobium salinum TaxID=1364940 RepID=A0ABD5PA21_9EURY|nr:hypothetical protein [Halobium salinum]
MTVAVELGSRPVNVWWQSNLLFQQGDPFNIVTRSTRVADTGDIYTVDPPLRYVPLAVVHALTPGLSNSVSTHLYTTIVSYVVLPATVAAFFYAVGGLRSAVFTLLGFMSWRAVGVGRIGYHTGWWHYDHTLPFVFLALLAAHEALVWDTKSGSYALAAATGLVIGVSGLNQYIMGALTALIVVIACLWKRRHIELAICGTVGSAVGSIFLFAPPKTFSFVAEKATGTRLGVGAEWSLETIGGGFLSLFTTAGYLFPFVLILLVIGTMWHLDSDVSRSTILTASLLVLAPFWLITTVVVPLRWLSMLAQYILQYLLLGCVMIALSETLSGVSNRYWHRTNQLLFERKDRTTGGIWTVLIAALTVALITVVPVTTP